MGESATVTRPKPKAQRKIRREAIKAAKLALLSSMDFREKAWIGPAWQVIGDIETEFGHNFTRPEYKKIMTWVYDEVDRLMASAAGLPT